MLSQLHEALATRDPQHGLFVSAFDKDKSLIFSQGSWSMPASDVLDLIYENFLQENNTIKTITLHVVTDVQTGSADDLAHIDLTTTGIGIHDDDGNEGAILPQTAGIDSPHDALTALKTQANLHGKAHLVTFTVSDNSFTTS